MQRCRKRERQSSSMARPLMRSALQLLGAAALGPGGGTLPHAAAQALPSLQPQAIMGAMSAARRHLTVPSAPTLAAAGDGGKAGPVPDTPAVPTSTSVLEKPAGADTWTEVVHEATGQVYWWNQRTGAARRSSQACGARRGGDQLITPSPAPPQHGACPCACRRDHGARRAAPSLPWWPAARGSAARRRVVVLVELRGRRILLLHRWLVVVCVRSRRGPAGRDPSAGPDGGVRGDRRLFGHLSGVGLAVLLMPLPARLPACGRRLQPRVLRP